MHVVVDMEKNQDKIGKALARSCSDFRRNELMSKHTTIGAGGPARFFAMPANAREVIALVKASVRHGVDYMVIGRGSNLLVRDGGFDGLIIRLASNLGEIDVRANTIYAEAGVSFTRLGRTARKNGRPGFEFAIGIPGSVGGAVRMNAGAFGCDLARVLKSARLIKRDGSIITLTPQDLNFGYRHSTLPEGAIIVSTIFHARPGELSDAELERTLKRKDTQPLSDRSFGSTFRNPPGAFAAELIEKSDLKGTRRGGAMVSKKHANFIVNMSDDTNANDVEDLVAHVIATVYARFQVRLKPEVVIVGNR